MNIKRIGIIAAALVLMGCAMTPEEQARFAEAFQQGMQGVGQGYNNAFQNTVNQINQQNLIREQAYQQRQYMQNNPVRCINKWNPYGKYWETTCQ